MTAGTREQRWRDVIERLRQGPSPRGETFDLCRRVMAVATGSPEAVEAARVLLEGAMADATTDSIDAQDIMAILKASSSGAVHLADLLRTP